MMCFNTYMKKNKINIAYADDAKEKCSKDFQL